MAAASRRLIADRVRMASDVALWRSPSALWALARESVGAWIDDFAPSMGAAISYYTVFSIAPLLLIVIGIAGLVLGNDAAAGRIYAELATFLGSDGAAAVQGMVKSASTPQTSVAATLVGIVVLLIGATTVFAELQSALDRIWRAPAPKLDGILGLLRARLLSFGLILTVGFLLLVSLLLSTALAALGAWWAPLFGAWELLLQVVNFVVSLGMVTILFAIIYKVMPRADIGWRDVWIGAAVTGVLFTIGKLLIGLYIGKTGVVSGFGAAGSLVVVLIWVYYSAQIFLLGAEFTWLYAYRFGSRRGEQSNATLGTGESTKARNTSAPVRPQVSADASPAVVAAAATDAGFGDTFTQWVRIAKIAFAFGNGVAGAMNATDRRGRS